MQCSPFPLQRPWTSLLWKGCTSSAAGLSSSLSRSPNGHSLSPCRSASSKQWLSRQTTDRFAREAKVQGLKSRAAFKLLQINDKYRLFKPGMTVVDLGFAPGSWSQVETHLPKTLEWNLTTASGCDRNDQTIWPCARRGPPPRPATERRFHIPR